MEINEIEVTGKKFRQLMNEATKLWQKISFWTKSSDVEFDDGKNAETKVGAIDGITDSLVSTSSNIAASAKAVSTINNNLGGCSFEQEGEDFYIVGADAVRKKLGNRSGIVVTLITTGNGSSGGTAITLTIKDSDGSTIYSKKVSNSKNNSLSYTFP